MAGSVVFGCVVVLAAGIIDVVLLHCLEVLLRDGCQLFVRHIEPSWWPWLVFGGGEAF